MRPKTSRRKLKTQPVAGGGEADQRAIEVVLAAFAHDVRTPLTGILASADLLAASHLGARERAFAMNIKNAAEHLAQFVTIVCDGVKLDATGLVLRQEPFSPQDLAEAAGTSLSVRAQAAGLPAEISIADDLPARLSGDAVRLRAALENLIDNAVKFTARGAVKLHAVAKPVDERHVALEFAVSDSGIGLSDDDIKTLFHPFAQANDLVARRYGGSGLGLTLVRRLAVAMGGDLRVTSKPAQGSTFYLSVVCDLLDQ